MVKIEDFNEGWTLKHPKKDIELSVNLPCTVFEALIENGIIKDPFYGLEEYKVKWVYESDWIYEKKFDIEKKQLESKYLILKFHGLDTICDIEINGQHAAFCNNMFRYYEIDIKKYVNLGTNTIKITFQSPTRYAREQIRKYGTELKTFHGHPGVPYLRKAQYSFGWDWGPAIPDIGIWREVEIIYGNYYRITDFYIHSNIKFDRDPLSITKDNIQTNETIRLRAEYADLFIELEVSEGIWNGIMENEKDINSEEYFTHITITDPGNKQIISEKLPLKQTREGYKFKIEQPELWWTNDLGSQPLYKIEMKLYHKLSGNDSEQLDSRSIDYGLRDIRLIRKDDRWGQTFFFLLNGIPVFAKGANWIPVDQFIPRGKKLGLYTLNLNYAKEANMNFIRVWGGGIYELEIFYNLCQKLGILVWQDMPFACSIYPWHEEFRENVKNEVIQNVKILRNHTALALWCGNNEIESLFQGYITLHKLLWHPLKTKKFKENYKYLFENLFPELIKKYDPKREQLYWPSSPSNGIERSSLDVKRLIKQYLSNDNDENNYGDSHFWKVWHLSAPFSEYRKVYSRFMSEFGFESFPSIKTLETIAPEDQFDFYSPIMESHQKNSAGNKKIMKYMKRRFKIPNDFEKQVILSQITHAEAMEYGVEHWRRNRNYFRCMGALYWQLNDCWPVASWASLDYYTRWKVLHYFAKRFYRPVFPSVEESQDGAKFWITNDLPETVRCTFNWELLDDAGNIVASDEYGEIIVSPCYSLEVGELKLDEISGNKNPNDLIIFYTMRISGDKENSEKIYHGFRLFNAPKYFKLNDPQLTYELNEDKENNKLTLKVSAKSVALFISIDSPSVDIRCSDNYFSLKPNETRIIELEPLNTTDPRYNYSGKSFNEFVNAVRSTINVKSLYDLLFGD